MRILLFFDLPMETSREKRAYRSFRKGLIGLGFVMMQKSVYSKIALNGTAKETIIRKVRKIRPEKGLVQILTITEKQFANIETMVGEVKEEVGTGDERIVIL